MPETRRPLLLPARASYRPGEELALEARLPASATGTVTVWQLGNVVQTVSGVGDGQFTLDPLVPGSYGVELDTGGSVLRTAIEVTAHPRRRLRYGFIASYAPDKDVAGVTDLVRRLHLTGVQFYDWAYRHADLLGGGEDYLDALGQPISLAAVRRLVAGVQSAGARAFGYAAVYGVGPDEWSRWKDHALLTAAGEPYALGDFLFLVDPAAPPWLQHFLKDLADSMAAVGFDGFHLDQYGYPKRALTPDGPVVDVAESFVRLIDGARKALPQSHLLFNNVNDFPTWRTASTGQDGVYIEVWPPHVTLGSLADVVNRAKAARRDQPVVVAAYQQVYAQSEPGSADRAAALTMATLFSHGATQLLAGEADRVLVDPYYVRNHEVTAQTADFLARWYDFLVEHDALLLDPALADVTGSYSGPYNDDADVTYADCAVTDRPEAGAVWRRITATPDGGLVIHLINLHGQPDTLWDAPREVPQSPGTALLRFRVTGGGTPRVRYADPDLQSRLIDVPMEVDGGFATAQLPAPHLWQLVYITGL